MHLRAHLGEDRLDFGPVKHPAKEFDSVTAHVHGDAAPRSSHVPEMVRVRAVVLFGLLEQSGLSERARIEQLLQANIFWSETKLLGIHQLAFRLAAGSNHLVRFRKVHAKRFFHNDMFARSERGQSDLAMEEVWHAD